MYILAFLTLAVAVHAANTLTITNTTQGRSVTINVLYTTDGVGSCTGGQIVVTGADTDYRNIEQFILGNNQTKTVQLTNLPSNKTYTVQASCVLENSVTTRVSATSSFTIGTPPPAPVGNRPPVVTAGTDQSLMAGQSTTILQGTASDPERRSMQYKWVKVSGSGVLEAPTSLRTAVTGLTVGTSTFTLFVTDDRSVVSSDDITITVPAAPAGTDNPAPAPQKDDAKTGSVQVLVNGACTTVSADPNQCKDGFDNQICDGKDYGYGVNKGDHKADHYGVDTVGPNGKGDGVLDTEPDPSCFSEAATTETGDDVVSTIIPCTDKCTLTDVFRLLNNVITFFFKVILIPIFVVMLMYAGYQYLTAEGNPGKKANLKKMIGNFVKGILLILCAWLIVRTIMTTVLNDEFKESGVELLEN